MATSSQNDGTASPKLSPEQALRRALSQDDSTPDLEWLRETIEPEDLERMRQLGVRPTYYRNNDEKGSHPDQRPCPPWCWVGQYEEYGHEIDRKAPFVAAHSMEADPTITASLYGGHGYLDDGRSVVQTASLETGLRQRGQGKPFIEVNLRHWPDGQTQKYEKRLVLGLEDAQELIIALTFLVDTAEGRA